MEITCVKPNISEFGFLTLLISTIILQDKNPIFENKKLQRELYEFHDKPNFHILFEDICKKESIEGNNYIVLNNAFQTAYAWGLLSMIQDSGDLKSIIILSAEEAQKNISQFKSHHIKAMNDLVTHLYKDK